MADIGDLHALAGLLLQSAAEALDSVNAYAADLEGAQTRQFISPGKPVLDCCDQLAIYVPILSFADTSPGGLEAGKRAPRGAINQPTFQIYSTRCIPEGTTSTSGVYKAPTAAALTASARQINADGWALWNHLYWLQSSGLLLSLCDAAYFDGISAIEPSGGCAGWISQIRCSINGYEPTFST